MGGIEVSGTQLNSIINATADAIVIVDAAGVVRFANSAAATLFGRPLDQIVGKPFGFPLVAGETAELDIMRPGEAPAVAELRVVEALWEGQPAAVASLRDITERKLAERHARELLLEQIARAHAEADARRTRFLLEATNALGTSLAAVDTLGKLAELCVRYAGDWCVIDLIETNRTVSRVAVTPVDDADASLAAELRALLPERQPLPDEPGVLQFGRSARITDWAERIAAVDDAKYKSILQRIAPHEAIIVPMKVRDRTVGTLTMISSRSKRTYSPADVTLMEEIACYAAAAVDNSRLFQAAERGNKAKANFLAVMSHELRTPLNAIIGYADLLTVGVPVEIPAAAQQHVKRIRTSARHLLRLIEEILTFTRLEGTREPITLEEVQLSALLQDVGTVIQPWVQKRALELSVRIPDNDYAIHTAPDKLRRVLLNLLSNAVKFTPAGSVTLEAEPVHDWTHFHVRDTGIGIRAEHLEHIFEPFWQAEQKRTRKNEGTGMGLSVARRLAAQLGGTLVVQSAPGQGSTFTLQLPNQGPLT